jgi:hypothetical protein
MHDTEIRKYILDTFEGVKVVTDTGNSFFFYDPDNKIPFATIVVNDDYDDVSDLNRDSVCRLNIGVSKQTYQTLFRTETEDGVEIPHNVGHDLTALDTLMPHPVYGKMYWICVLNPSQPTFESVKPMLKEAYEIAVKKYERLTAARPRSEIDKAR